MSRYLSICWASCFPFVTIDRHRIWWISKLIVNSLSVFGFLFHFHFVVFFAHTLARVCFFLSLRQIALYNSHIAGCSMYVWYVQINTTYTYLLTTYMPSRCCRIIHTSREVAFWWNFKLRPTTIYRPLRPHIMHTKLFFFSPTTWVSYLGKIYQFTTVRFLCVLAC